MNKKCREFKIIKGLHEKKLDNFNEKLNIKTNSYVSIVETLNPCEKLFRKLFEFCPEGIIIVNPLTYKIINANCSFCKLFGYSLDEVLNLKIFDLHHPNFHESIKEDFNVHIGNEEKVRHGVSCLKKNKSLIYANITIFFIKIENEEFVVNYFTDITYSERFEKELISATQKYKDIVDNICEWVWEVNSRGKYIYAGAGIKKLLGYEPEEIIGKTPFDLMPEAEAEKNRSLFFQIARNKGTIQKLENINVHKNGKMVILETSAVPVFDTENKLTGYRGFDKDITLAKKIEKCFNELNKLQIKVLQPGTLKYKLDLVTEYVVKAFDVDFARIWLIRSGDRCEKGCPHAAVKTGPHVCIKRELCLHLVSSSGHYTNTELGMHSRVPFGCYKIGGIASGKYPSFITNDLEHDERIHNLVWAKENGLVSFAGFKLAVPNDKTEGVIAFFSKNEITKEEFSFLENFSHIVIRIIKAAELERQLIQTQKMDAIGELAGGIAHDFNNFLANILGYAKLFLEEYKINDSKYDYVNEIKKQAEQATEVIKQMLTFARPSDDLFSFTDVGTIISESLELLNADFKKDIKIIINIKNYDLSIKCIKIQVQQALLNLIKNASDAMLIQDVKEILISVNEILVAKKEADLLFLKPGQYVEISVKDNGPGIPENLKQKLFLPFVSGNIGKKGTGLGLSIVKRIVEKHNGAIKVSSTAGKGASFSLLFPYNTENFAIPEKHKLSKRNFKILIAEDNDDLRKIYKIFLRKSGYSVTAAKDGLQAFGLYSKNPKVYDLILTDQVMPKMTGLELAKKVISINPKMPIIIVSAFNDIDEDEAFENGVKYFLNKPVNYVELTNKISGLLPGNDI